MKHLWFGAGLLAALLAVSLWLGAALEDTHHEPARDLEKAADAALEDNWDLAEALYARARQHWQKHRNLIAALTHHDQVEQMDAGFAALEIHLQRQSAGDFGALCTQLAQELRVLPQSHGFTWWNLL